MQVQLGEVVVDVHTMVCGRRGQCNAAQDKTSKETGMVGNQTMSGTQRVVGSRLDSLEFMIFLSKTTTVCSQSLEPNVNGLDHMSICLQRLTWQTDKRQWEYMSSLL